MHNIFSGPQLLLICKFCLKNAQYYVANLLKIQAELFFTDKSETFARFLCHIMYHVVECEAFLRNPYVFYSISTSLLCTWQSSDAGHIQNLSGPQVSRTPVLKPQVHLLDSRVVWSVCFWIGRLRVRFRVGSNQ